MIFIEISSGKIAVRDHGAGDTTLVFLHGNSLSSQTYEHQFSGSLSDNFRLLALDFPGHGESSDAEKELAAIVVGIMHFASADAKAKLAALQ